jgi:hypothetical protein
VRIEKHLLENVNSLIESQLLRVIRLWSCALVFQIPVYLLLGGDHELNLLSIIGLEEIYIGLD